MPVRCSVQQCLHCSSEQSDRSLSKSVGPATWQHSAQATTPSARAVSSPGHGYNFRFTQREIVLAAVIAQRDQNIQVAVVEIQKIPQTLLSCQANEILAAIRPFVSTRVLWGSQRSGHPHRHVYTPEPCTSPGLASLPTRLDGWTRSSTHSTHRQEAEDRVTYYCVCGGRVHANIQVGSPL